MKKIIEYFYPEYKKLRIENKKLQKENAKMYNDIYILVKKPTFQEFLEVNDFYEINFNILGHLIDGDATSGELTGLI